MQHFATSVTLRAHKTNQLLLWKEDEIEPYWQEIRTRDGRAVESRWSERSRPSEG